MRKLDTHLLTYTPLAFKHAAEKHAHSEEHDRTYPFVGPGKDALS